MLDLVSPLSEGPLLQDKVIVGGRVHGIEHIGVFWDLQLWWERGRGQSVVEARILPPLESLLQARPHEGPKGPPIQLYHHQGPLL